MLTTVEALLHAHDHIERRFIETNREAQRAFRNGHIRTWQAKEDTCHKLHHELGKIESVFGVDRATSRSG